jgi:Ca2+-binding RTX toxin-like protein
MPDDGDGDHDVLTSIEGVLGTEFADIIEGFLPYNKGGDYRFYGYGGNDKITSDAGNDVLDGGAGNDILRYGSGRDSVFGGEGDDVIEPFTGSSTDLVGDILDGGAGNDKVYGFYGRSPDTLLGGDGNDTLFLGDGDTATGGIGTDVFWVYGFSASPPVPGDPWRATITDFRVGEEIRWGATIPIISGSDVIWFAGPITSGTGASTGLNRVQHSTTATQTMLYFGFDENPGADFILTVNGIIPLAKLQVDATNRDDIKLTFLGDVPGPTAVSLTRTSVLENSAANTLVGSLSFTHALANQTVAYSLIDDAGGRFALEGTNLVTTAAFDREGDQSFNVSVRATDANGIFFDRTFAIGILDVNEAPPTITSNGGGDADALVLAENFVGTVATVSATDADATTNIVYSISGGADQNRFLINPATGGLSFRAPPDFETPLDSERDNVYEVEVQATDGLFSDRQLLTISVTNTGGVTITGTSASDTINAVVTVPGQPLATDEEDVITGGEGNDIIDGRGGNDLIEGGAGNDKITGGFNGRAGDTATYANAQSGITLSLALLTAQNTGGAGVDTLSGIENIVGSGYGDVLTGDKFRNTISGGAGHDLIQGGGEADTLDGGADNDTVSYALSAFGVSIDLTLQATAEAQFSDGDGSGDILTGFENIIGSAKNDRLVGDGADNVIDGGLGNDVLVGGLGIDTVSYARATTAVIVNLATGLATGGAGADSLSEFENVTGGLGADKLTGDALHNVLLGGSGNDVLIGGAGNDTLDGGAGTGDTASYETSTDGVTIDLSLSGSQDTVGAGTDTLIGIENVVGGTGNDVLTGDIGINRIDGGLGDDTIEGGAGNDVLIGGGSTALPGSDTVSYAGSNLGVKVSLLVTSAQNTGGAGIDTISGFENLTGSGFDDTLTGSALANIIAGGAGNDLVRGAQGADKLDGGTGNDTVSYAGSTVGVAVNLAQQGAPDAFGNADFGLPGTAQTGGDAAGDLLWNFENIVGSSFIDNLTGDDLDNVIEGGLGNDVLKGALGTDTVSYASSSTAVIVNLAAGTATGGAGVDSLEGFENILGGAGSDTLTGNDGVNTLTGNGGNDILNGGLGADVMVGGAGNDVYVVDEVGDSVIELAAQGIDKVRSSIDYTLGANIENLELTGTDPLNGTGNELANTIIGNAGDNTLDGGIDALASTIDQLMGGLGNDTYVVSTLNDKVTELANQGTDTVKSHVTYTLGLYVENLELQGAASINGTGNAIANTITGNDERNVLSGLGGNDTLDGAGGDDVLNGGVGNDTLTGGSGADDFVFNTALSTATVQNVDAIIGFEVGIDEIVLENAIFTTIGLAGDLATTAFVIGTGASTAQHRMIYDDTTGHLFYDRDGTGTAAQIQIATLESGLTMSFGDFLII